MPTTLQGLTLVATLAASGAAAAGQTLDRYGSRTHPGFDPQPGPAASAAPLAAADPTAGVRFYALHRDYGLTPDLKPAQPPITSGAPATEVSATTPAAPPATAPARPGASPSDF